MEKPQVLLEDIRKLKDDLESQNLRLPPGLAGMYGEILAYQKLQEICKGSKYQVNYFSGQKGADLQLTDGHHKINVEIKTSRLKDEGFGMWYGVALNIKKCRIEKHKVIYNHPRRGRIEGDFCYFDYIVFVALSKDLTAKYYIVPRDFIEKNEKQLRNDHARFSSSTHQLRLSDGINMPKVSARHKKVIRETEKFENRWDLIKLINNAN